MIDTSSIVAIRRSLPREDAATAYRRLTKAAQSGSIVFPREVYDELDREHRRQGKPESDPPYEWVRDNRAVAQSKGRLFAEVAELLQDDQIAEVVDPARPRDEDEADPYILALAIALRKEGRDVLVVTEEKRDRPGRLSLSSACGLLGLPAAPVLPYMRREGIWPTK